MSKNRQIRWQEKPTLCSKCNGSGTDEDKKGREIKCRYCIDGYNYNRIVKYDLGKREKQLDAFLGEE